MLCGAAGAMAWVTTGAWRVEARVGDGGIGEVVEAERVGRKARAFMVGIRGRRRRRGLRGEGGAAEAAGRAKGQGCRGQGRGAEKCVALKLDSWR